MAKAKQNLKIQMLAGKEAKTFFESTFKNLPSLVDKTLKKYDFLFQSDHIAIQHFTIENTKPVFLIFSDIVKSYKGKFSTKLLASRSYGTVESNPSQYSCAITDHWNVEGPFRKIGIKLDDSDSQIVQGLRIELVDGSVRSFGISNHCDDEKDIFDLEVPKGQHIRQKNCQLAVCLLTKKRIFFFA